MNKKLMSLAAVVVVAVAGCHAPPEGAVCPAPEEDVEEAEATSGAEAQQLSKEDLEKARQYLRATRNQ